MAKRQKEEKKEKRFRFSFDWRTWLPAIVLGILYLLAGFWLLPFRFFLTFAILCLIVSIAAVLCIILVFKDQRLDFCLPTFAFLAIFSIFFIIDSIGRYSFIGNLPFPFWKISLILSIPIGILITVLCAKKVKLLAKLGCAAVLIGIAFLFVEIHLWHLNYIFDFKEPLQKVARIEDKYERYNQKSSDTYHFVIRVNGEEFYLEVSVLDYEKYEIGDVYEFEQYQGAFGVPFLLAQP